MNHIGFWSVFKKDKVGWTIFPVGQNFRKRQYELNHIIFWSKVSINKTWVELYCLKLKIFLTGNMGWILLSFGQNFLKHYMRWKKLDNKCWRVLLFGRNFLTRLYGLNCLMFWSKFSKKTVWIELHFLFITIFLKGNME